jgi:flagellar biosynthesis/type III secretory pathway protein FliH
MLDGHVGGLDFGSSDDNHAESAVKANQALMDEKLKSQKAEFVQACKVLNEVIAGLNEFCDKMFSVHKEEIAHLSVEIARKILMFKVENGDYEIESIVKGALENAPGRREIAVHLHPDDLEKCQKAQENEPNGALAGIKLVADSNIARAECLLESPKGIVKSLIDENLERIASALKNG